MVKAICLTNFGSGGEYGVFREKNDAAITLLTNYGQNLRSVEY